GRLRPSRTIEAWPLPSPLRSFSRATLISDRLLIETPTPCFSMTYKESAREIGQRGGIILNAGTNVKFREFRAMNRARPEAAGARRRGPRPDRRRAAPRPEPTRDGRPRVRRWERAHRR